MLKKTLGKSKWVHQPASAFIYSLSTNVDRFSYNPDQPPQLACQGPLSSVELAKELVMSWSEFHSKPIIYKRNMVC